MIQHALNTLYVQSPNAYVKLDHDTLRVEVDGQRALQVPLHHLGGIVLFGNGMMSPQAMQRCANENREVVFLDYSGRFMCRVVGRTNGNVLLRMAQYATHTHDQRCADIARRIVAAKVRNSRQTVMRGAREAKSEEQSARLRQAGDLLRRMLESLPQAATLDQIRGIEGESAAAYFGVFDALITVPTKDFSFVLRTRRPPRDRVNALLSFLYSVLTNDCVSAAESVGLDPQVGFLHALRPGRPAMALDLVEEFRSGVADRLVLALINRRQLRPEHFEIREEGGGSVLLNDEGRRAVITAYQKKKEEPVQHPLLKDKIALGLAPQIQARIMARFLRADMENYQPFIF